MISHAFCKEYTCGTKFYVLPHLRVPDYCNQHKKVPECSNCGKIHVETMTCCTHCAEEISVNRPRRMCGTCSDCNTTERVEIFQHTFCKSELDLDGTTIKMKEYDLILRILNEHISVCHTTISALEPYEDENPNSTKEAIEEWEQEIFAVKRIIAKITAKQYGRAMEGLQ